MFGILVHVVVKMKNIQQVLWMIQQNLLLFHDMKLKHFCIDSIIENGC